MEISNTVRSLFEAFLDRADELGVRADVEQYSARGAH